MEAYSWINLGMGRVLAQKAFTLLLQDTVVRRRCNRGIGEGGASGCGRISIRHNSRLGLAHRALGQVSSIIGPALGAGQTISGTPGAELETSGEIFRRRDRTRDHGIGRR